MALLAMSTSALYTGRLAESVRFAEIAQTVGEARGDVRAAGDAILFRMGAFAALGEPERAQSLARDAMARASASGDSVRASSVVIAVATNYLNSPDPDFAATVDFLAAHPVETPADHMNGVWLDLTWALSLLGLGRSDAIGHAARAARNADRVNSLSLLDYAIRQLAVIADDHGLSETAIALLRYADSVLVEHRLLIRGQEILQDRIEQVVAGASPPGTDNVLRRNDVMALVDEVEAAIGGQEVV